MSRYYYLSECEIFEALDSLAHQESIEVIRIRYRNKDEIRCSVIVSLSDLKKMIQQSIKEGALHGGELEISIPRLGSNLIGHHDGVFWLEAVA